MEPLSGAIRGLSENPDCARRASSGLRWLARNQILLYGSDDVIIAYDKWVAFTDNGGKGGSDEDVAFFGNLLLKIRQDIVGKTKVTVKEISNLNPFSRG
ncbi:MAG: hypothetical protein ACOYMG_17420 [Candidatus Methylumidiphilus sp.]